MFAVFKCANSIYDFEIKWDIAKPMLLAPNPTEELSRTLFPFYYMELFKDGAT